MLALPRKGPRRGPGFDDQIVRLMKALVRVKRVDRRAVVLGPNATHKARDDATARHVVEHGELFGDVNRVAHQGQGATQNRNANALGALDQGAGDQVGRGHQAISGLVVLVDTHAVKAQGFRFGQQVDVALVFVRTQLGVVKGIGQDHPSRAVLFGCRDVQRTVRHQGEIEDFHAASRAMKA
jgi:hypothetical protein